MKIAAYVPETYLPIFGVIPVVFMYLWSLIAIDIKNFEESRKACTVFAATDPVECYKNYIPPEESKVE